MDRNLLRQKEEGRSNTLRVIVGVIAIVVAGSAAALWAQTRVEDGGGSLAALTAEVRLLRAAVEESSKAQTQTQALGVSLSAQQSRMQQISSRLETTRSELVAVTARLREANRLLEGAKADLAQTTNPQERKQEEGMIAMFAQGVADTTEQERRLRARDAELTQALQIEEQRWADLIARLEQLTRK